MGVKEEGEVKESLEGHEKTRIMLDNAMRGMKRCEICATNAGFALVAE